ncbi:MAG: hypothetical protein N2255_04885 [Kiritimatiellae bacterium]|nr:hypothetical protein [Kiritimatiellia bacterium]
MTKRWWGLWLAAVAMCITATAGFGGVRFVRKPAIARAGEKVRIEFEVDQPADVEVAILDAQGRVIRHLAAGMLGSTNAPPPPLKPGLVQALEWDGRDDLGRTIGSTGTRVRVRAGMGVKTGGFVGSPDILEEKIYGLATDPQGSVYVATGGGYGDNVFTIKVFDRDGKYQRTIFPYPANLKPEEVEGFAAHVPRDGRLNPPQFHPLLPWIYPDGLGGLIGNKVVDGVVWLTSGSGRICKIRAADGACVAWNAGKPPAPRAQGPICWALSPDGGALYLSGWFQKGRVADGQVFKVDPATGERTEFLKIDVPTDSFWLNEPNGWYDFTNWGRKNGVAAIHGVAVDASGRVYVCDRVNNRIAVYDSSGKFLGATAVEQPDHVVLSSAGPELYVTTRKILDGYKARNEVKVVKLSAWQNGTVVAELTFTGHNAPSFAVDTSRKPVVLWLSNVGEKGGVTRIEDRGTELVVAGQIGDSGPSRPGAVVKVWADPKSDTIVVSDGWNGQFAFNGVTGESLRWPLKGMELAFDRDGNYYVYGQAGWHELVTRFDREFNPLPFPATGKNVTTLTTTGKDVYGRYGHGWCNKGLWVAPDGRIFVYHMYEWSKYYVSVWDANGQAEKHERVSDGLIGPLDTNGGGVCVDFQGNVYVGMHGFPRSAARGRSDGAGSVVKFGPTGGGYVAERGEKPGLEWRDGLMPFVEGGLAAYTGLAPQPGSRGCVCKEARFDVDGWGRIYIPNALEYCVRIVDNAGNELLRCGYYGNADSRGPGSSVPEPEIAFGWPIAVSVGQLDRGRIFVADTLNHRVCRLDVMWQVEELAEIR